MQDDRGYKRLCKNLFIELTCLEILSSLFAALFSLIKPSRESQVQVL